MVKLSPFFQNEDLQFLLHSALCFQSYHLHHCHYCAASSLETLFQLFWLLEVFSVTASGWRKQGRELALNHTRKPIIPAASPLLTPSFLCL